jgi:hypothetical protein
MGKALASSPELDVFSRSRMKFEKIITELTSKKTDALAHGDVERLLWGEGKELLAELLQGYLDSKGPGLAAEPVEGVDGKPRTYAREKERTLHSSFGEVVVSRMSYEAHAGPSLAPRDAELNLPASSFSHEVSRRLAKEALRGSIDDAVEALAETTGAKVHKRQALALIAEAAADFTDFYAAKAVQNSQQVAQTAAIMVLSFDGKGIVMRHEALREKTQLAAKAEQHKLKTRLSTGEKRNGKRMAQVAAVYTIEPYIRTADDVMKKTSPAPGKTPPCDPRPRPEDKRVWASLEKESSEVIKDAFDEARRRDPQFTKQWAILVDGNEPQIKLAKAAALKCGVKSTVVLDFIHVTEYVWRASFALFGSGSVKGERWVQERLLRILRGQSSEVAAGMRRGATLRKLCRDARSAIDTCANYLLKYREYLHYDAYMAAGLPIATGVIEGACRHLIKDRMDITGARWGLDGAESILRLRSIKSSGDWDEYWAFHEKQEWGRNHAAKYIDKTPPQTIKPARRGQLRVVK